MPFLKPAPVQPPVPEQVVIQGRFCLAYKKLSCSVCSERCPEPGAIQIRDGIPRIDPLICTACGVCRQVCPAPRNAILIVPRPSSPASPPYGPLDVWSLDIKESLEGSATVSSASNHPSLGAPGCPSRGGTPPESAAGPGRAKQTCKLPTGQTTH